MLGRQLLARVGQREPDRAGQIRRPGDHVASVHPAWTAG
jgi:hypothetical protein